MLENEGNREPQIQIVKVGLAETQEDASNGSFKKRDAVAKKLLEREERRITEIIKRKDLAERSVATNESATFFSEQFSRCYSSIKAGLLDASNKEKSLLNDYFDNLISQFQSLQKYTSDSAIFLSGFDLRQKQDMLNNLQSDITTQREALLPKQRFAFRTKKKQVFEVSGKSDNESSKESQAVCKELSERNQNELSVKNLMEKQIQIEDVDVGDKDIVMASIVNCTVTVKGNPSAMQMNDITNSVIMCGPCTRSIFIENCSKCTFVLACQQLRIHHTSDCDFYIHVTSKAIIEDCTDMRFAPFSLIYPAIEEHFERSGLKKQVNNWNLVDDFNWLVLDQQSPHWSIIDESQRKKFLQA